MISFGCFLITSSTGARSIFWFSTSCRNTGVSRIPRRIHNPIPTSTIDIANGMRQPQIAN